MPEVWQRAGDQETLAVRSGGTNGGIVRAHLKRQPYFVRSVRKLTPIRERNPVSPQAHRYILFHKPYGVLSQFTSEHGSRWRTLSEFDLPKDVYAVGRLDADSEGLLLLTNDGALIKRLLEPRFAHPRMYWAQVEGAPTEEALAKLRAGVILDDRRTRPCGARILQPEPDLPAREPRIRYRARIPTSWIEITLTEGRNRQVRRMTAAVGHPTLRLIRVAIGLLRLGDLASATWRELSRSEIMERVDERA